MTLKAKRKLHQAGKSGNWRFKGLLLAALDHDVTPEDVANAWPSPGNPSDYRFLRQSDRRDPEQEADRRVVAEQGEERHRMLRDYVQNAGNTPKHLSSDPTTELGDGSLGVRLDDAIPRMLFAASTFEEVEFQSLAGFLCIATRLCPVLCRCLCFNPLLGFLCIAT